MSGDEQANSDPLPYTQVDRAVKPKATLLAALMGTTTQHALGSLVEFWDLNGDPRELEKLMAEGKREVVLTREAAKLRFRLASAHDVEPESLEALGLLERVSDGFRVRGMSRYFAPVEGRKAKRAAAKAGGIASVRARKEKYGSAQPMPSPERNDVRSGSGSGVVREQFELPPKHARSTPEAEPEAPPKQTPKQNRTPAVSGQRSAAGELLLGDKRPGEGSEPVDPRYQPMVGRLLASYLQVVGVRYSFQKCCGKALKELLKVADDDEIDRRWRIGLTADQYSPKCATVLQLHARWNELAVVRGSRTLAMDSIAPASRSL